MNVMRMLHQIVDTATGLCRFTTFRMPDSQKNTSIGRLIQETAAKTPDATMIVTSSETWTWGQFNRRANQFAHALSSLGIVKKDCVAIRIENTPEFLAAMVGVAKLGAVSALVSTRIKGHALVHSLETVKPRLILVGDESVPSLSDVVGELDPELAGSAYHVGPQADANGTAIAVSLSQLADSQTETDLEETLSLQLLDTAYYVYTSGTTGGLPKAVIVPHFFWYRASYSFSHLLLHSKPTDRIFVSLPMFHTAALLIGLGVCAQSGCSMYLARKFSSSRFLDEARRHKTNVFLYIGELCRYLLNTPARPSDRENPIQKIIGNGLRPEIWDEFCSRFAIRRVSEYYGSTEGTTSFMNILNRRNTIGMCLTPHELISYDQDDDAEKRNAEGLCCKVQSGQPGLLITPMTEKSRFNGYTSRDETRKKMLHDVFERGDEYFNAGDMLRRANVGFTFGIRHYQFVDRVGETYRWKGENTSATDVAEVINSVEGADVTCVYGVRIPNSDGRAGMAAIQGDAASICTDRIMEHLKKELPGHSWPIFLRIVESLEYTPTHKIKNSTLKAEGYDIAVVKDPIYVLSQDRIRYEELTQAAHQVLLKGKYSI